MFKSNGGLMLVTAMLVAGGSACEKHGDTGRPYSVDMVRTVFKEETGDELIVERSAARNPVVGVDVTLLGVAPPLDAKYGDFGITVWGRLGDRKRRLLYGGRQPDKTGITWQYYAINEENHEPTWSASKWYGNVALIWFHKTRETNDQWDRLDRALSLLDSSRL
jgi:hypothetical protein